VIFRENFAASHWLVLQQQDAARGKPYFLRFADCTSYEDAARIVQAMNVTEPS
jgi:hypothetical protein